MTDQAERLHAALVARGQTVAAAESLTAGLFCATLASVPGASRTLRGGAVVYATDLKTALADVPADLLADHGPVSEPTAAALATGIRTRCAATWGIGLTGVAGPDPVDGHGPGRVYLGISDGTVTEVTVLDLPGARGPAHPGDRRERRRPGGRYAMSGRHPARTAGDLPAAYGERKCPRVRPEGAGARQGRPGSGTPGQHDVPEDGS